MYIFRVFWLLTPTQNLPEIQQQHSLSVQYFLLTKSSIFSRLTLCSPLGPHDLFLLDLSISTDALTSLFVTIVWEKSVRSTCEQEVITRLHEGINRHGQTGWGQLTGRGETWSLYRKTQEKGYIKWQFWIYCVVLMFRCIFLNPYQCLLGNYWFEDCDSHSKWVPQWRRIRRIPKAEQAAVDGLSTPALLAAAALIAEAQTGAGFVDRSQGGLGWALVAETELKTEAVVQILFLTRVGPITEVGGEQNKNVTGLTEIPRDIQK